MKIKPKEKRNLPNLWNRKALKLTYEKCKSGGSRKKEKK